VAGFIDVSKPSPSWNAPLKKSPVFSGRQDRFVIIVDPDNKKGQTVSCLDGTYFNPATNIPSSKRHWGRPVNTYAD
jgi:hypothetical protein